MSEQPVSRTEMRQDIADAEARSHVAVDAVVAHFDQRLKDSERVLTWRMIATMGVGSTLTVVLGAFAGEEPARQAVGHLARLIGV